MSEGLKSWPIIGFVVGLLACGSVFGVEGDWNLNKKYHQQNLCGPISLWCVCKYLKVDTSLDALTKASDYDGRATSVRGLLDAGKAVGLDGRAWRGTVANLKRIGGPAIITYPSGHFSVFLGWEGENAILFDPPAAERTVSVDELGKHWDGCYIVFSAAKTKVTSSRSSAK